MQNSDSDIYDNMVFNCLVCWTLYSLIFLKPWDGFYKWIFFFWMLQTFVEVKIKDSLTTFEDDGLGSRWNIFNHWRKNGSLQGNVS
jgi:hypothetical protein